MSHSAGIDMHMWRVPDVPGLECAQGRSSISFPTHFHETYCIPIIEQGAMASRYRGALRVLRAGQVDVLPPGEPHTGAPARCDSWVYRCFYLSPDAAAAFAGRDGPLDLTRDTGEFFLKVWQAHRLFELGESLAAQSRLADALAGLTSRGAESSVGRPGLERAREYLRANLDRNIAIARLAQEAGLSPAHFTRTFRRTYGLPPHAFQRQLRIQLAQRLIAEGRSLADVAAAVGFADQSHLTRAFRATLGWTPGAQAGRKSRSRQA